MKTARKGTWHVARKSALAVVGLLLLAAVAWFARGWLIDTDRNNPQLIFYTATKADLPIVVTERGNLESQIRTEIRCEVENSSVDRSGNLGTQIIFIVPNGSAVKKGDLLVELDSAAIRDKLDRQTLDYQRAKSAHTQALLKYENQKTQNETLEAEAELKVDLSKLALDMYMDPDSGEYKLSLDEIDRKVDESKNMIHEARSARALQQTERSGIQTLFELGYRGKSDVDQSQFKFMQAEDKLAAAMNQLMTNQASRHQMEKYTYHMKRKTFEGDVSTAIRNLKQVRNDNESKLDQALAAKQETEQTETKEAERLAKLKLQLEKCKIFAPHDGMAVYARESRYDNESEISEGVTVRERQHILSLPDLSQMQVKTQIHEAVLDQIQPGLPVTVRVDAFPNRTYVGVVEDVAVVPNSNGWYGSSVKTYNCVVRIPDRVENLNPGMTAVADIHVDRIRNVLSVPVQAVFQIEKDHWCYVEDPSGITKRKVEIGRSNDKFVHIASGLAMSDRVVLNPMSLWDAVESKHKEISPDSGAPDTPELPPNALLAKKSTAEKVAERKGSGKSKRSSGPQPGKEKDDTATGGTTPPTAAAPAGE